MFYSKSVGGFFDRAIHGNNIPADAVEITTAEHTALMQGQCAGGHIGADEAGRPVLIVPPPPTLTEAAVAKKAALAAYRYTIEVGGLTVNGMQVQTDDRSKTLIAGAKIDAVANPAILTDFKTATGWVQIDAATITAIAIAIAGHVRECYSCERIHSDAIDAMVLAAGTVAEIEAYDITTGWPV